LGFIGLAVFFKKAAMTTATAKAIQISLPTGEPRGIRIADNTTRLVSAVLIPGREMAARKLRIELDHPGFYFLFGEDKDRAKPIVYIGQTQVARKQFKSHNESQTSKLPSRPSDTATHTFVGSLKLPALQAERH
jgi:hypothetical protein